MSTESQPERSRPKSKLSVLRAGFPNPKCLGSAPAWTRKWPSSATTPSPWSRRDPRRWSRRSFAPSSPNPIGFVHVLEVPGSNHLEQLSVRPSAAHRGHGRALVDAAKSESRLRGCTRVTLRTFADVPWNVSFCSSCGFLEHDPDSEFLRDLLLAERKQGLGYGRRIQMNFDLTDEFPR